MGSPLDAHTIKLINVTQTYFAAMYAVALWDWVISLPKEYRRIYKAPMSLIKVLYYCNRYYTLANLVVVLYGFNSMMTETECQRFYKWEPGLASFTTIFAEAILVVRTYALWGKNKYILAVLLIGLITECFVLFFAVTQFHAVPTRDPTDPSSRGACIAGGGPGGHDWSMAYWVSPIVMDTLMLILTSVRALQYRHRGVNSSIFSTFVKDGILYFVVVFGVNLINTIFYSLPSQALQAINSPMSLLMTSIMCSHIVLSLRGEEKADMEAVSKDWQINTFLKKKRGERSGGSDEKKEGSHLRTFNDEDIYRNGIGMHPFSISDPSGHASDPYSGGLNLNSSGLIPSDGYLHQKYEGVQVDVEHGHKYDDEKSSITENPTKQVEIFEKA